MGISEIEFRIVRTSPSTRAHEFWARGPRASGWQELCHRGMRWTHSSTVIGAWASGMIGAWRSARSVG